MESGCKVAVVMNEQMILVYLTLSDWVLQEVASLDPWSRLVQTAPRNRKVQAGVPLDLQVLALDPDENDQVQVALNYLNVLAGVPQDLAVGLLG